MITYQLFDKYTFLENSQYMGALTGALLVVLEENDYTIKVNELIVKINSFMIENNLTQTPQLTSSYEYNPDIYLCINKEGLPFIR